MQHNEDERKCVSELINHPYIIKPYSEQQKLQTKHVASVFQNDKIGGKFGDLTVGKKKTRSTSAAPIQKSGLAFNAKDKSQAKRIELAFGEEEKL